MMKPTILLAALLVASTPAAAAKFGISFQPSADQSLRMQSGVGSLDSHTSRSSLRLIPDEEPIKKRGVLHVIVFNHGDKPFNVGPENFSARTATGAPIVFVTFEQLRREEKHRQTWRAIAAGLAAAGNNMSAANAGYSSGTAAYAGTNYGAYGTTQTYGVANWTAYDPGRAQAAQAVANAQNQQMFANLADQNAARLGALRETMRTTTIDPNQTFGGSIVFDLPDAARSSKGPVPFTINVAIDGETHTIAAVLVPQ